ncbi:hypothetical protein VaNZ11_008023 [Volvox africanus]|uniref:Rab-GAP TBC domain-containing protein n=1 Tax=Volvox africanus TaxID=51714 RepID=A0ABQ5S607_9CHLO|nr:hypothetical protein VaNZ11_008023 [Volvox africanus]
MNSRLNLNERRQSSTSGGKAERRTRDLGSDRECSDGGDERQPNSRIDFKSSSNRLLLDNVSYALQARLAFSPYLANATMDATVPYVDSEPRLPEPLCAARTLLQRALLQRLRELQLMVEWPLLRPPCTSAQMERLLAGGISPSELAGVRSGPPLEYPRLPPSLQGLCLLGPMDFAVALAIASAPSLPQQQLAKLDWMPLSQTGRGGVAGSAVGGGGGGTGQEGTLGWVSALPRTMGLMSGLPALASLPWPAPKLSWLRGFFRDLHPRQRHVGVDDRALPWFRDVKVAAARAVVLEGSVRGAATFSVFGVPHGVRAAVWETALGLRRPMLAAAIKAAVGSSHAACPSGNASSGGGGGGTGPGSSESSFGAEYAVQFERLCTQVLEQPLLLDIVVSEDVGPMVGDSEAFFLFEESVRAVLVAFQRDINISKRLSAPPLAQLHATNAVHAVLAVPTPTPATAAATGDGGRDMAEAGQSKTTGDGAGGRKDHRPVLPYYPASGVMPFRGISLLAAPLCYMYDNPASSYYMFRALYCRYWSKLHSLSACGPPSPALPGLLRVFEALMQELDPQLVTHLCRLGLLPVTLALPWITNAFSGALPVQEVLLLWDRIIGLDSLLPLPLLAAAVLCFRRHVLLSCTSPSEVVSALSDITQLRAVPLLQAVLFPGAGSDG